MDGQMTTEKIQMDEWIKTDEKDGQVNRVKKEDAWVHEWRLKKKL